MKMKVTWIYVLLIVFLFTSHAVAAKKTGTGKKPLTETVTISATIVSIDTATSSVVIKDQDGKLWEFMVPSQSGINLSQCTIGDTVTATGEIDAASQGTMLKSFVKRRTAYPP